MSDVAWGMLFTWLTLVSKAVIDELRERRKARDARELKAAVEANTDVIVQGQNLLAHKVESATKEVTDQAAMVADVATGAAKAATNAAVQNVLTSDKVLQQTKATNQTLEKLANGGPGGISTLTNGLTAIASRVTDIEGRVAIIEKGQCDLIKSMDHFSEVLERKLP